MNMELLKQLIRDRFDEPTDKSKYNQATEAAQLIELSQDLKMDESFINEMISDFAVWAKNLNMLGAWWKHLPIEESHEYDSQDYGCDLFHAKREEW